MVSPPPSHEAQPCPGCARPHSEARCSFCGVARAPGGLLVQHVIAQTPHGRLYQALDAQGHPVAVKELVFAHMPGPQWLEAFEREARVLQSLVHPRIPAFRGAFREGEDAAMRLYLVQQLVLGESLEERLAGHRFDEEEARDIARQVLEVLVYLHGRAPPVVHRDIKPANLLRRDDGRLVLVDFGSARVLAEGNASPATITGTFGYMAPEQLAGSASPRSDLYGLGATLLHLLSRQPPETLLRGDYAVVFGREVNVSRHFAAFLRRLVARRPEDRFPDAHAALLALDGPVEDPRTRRKRWALVGAGASVVAALLVVGAWGLLRTPAGPEPIAAPAAVVSRPAPVPAPAVPPAPAPAVAPAPAPAPPPDVTTPVLRAQWSLDADTKEDKIASETPGVRPLTFYRAKPLFSLRGWGVLLDERGALYLDWLGLPKDFMGSTGAVTFWVGRSGPGPGPLLTLLRKQGEGLVQVRMGWDGELRLGDVGRWQEVDATLGPDRYHHVALAWGPQGYRLWLDGRSVAKAAPREGEEVRPLYFSLGLDPALHYIPNARMTVDDVRLYAGVLEDKDVQALVEAVPERTSKVPPESVPRTQWASREQPVTVLPVHGMSDFQLPGSQVKSSACRGARTLELAEAVYTLVPNEPSHPPEDGSERETLLTLTFDSLVGSRQPRGRCVPELEARLKDMEKEGREYEARWLPTTGGAGSHPRLQVRLPMAVRNARLMLGPPQAPVVQLAVDLSNGVQRLTQVEGRVVDGRTGLPIAGARVGGWIGRSGSVSLTTGADGGFRFVTGAEEGSLAVTAIGRRRVDVPVRIESHASFRLADVRVEEPVVEPGKIGVWLEDAEGGVRLPDVFRSGPAWKAGLRPGDVITGADGHSVRTQDEAKQYLQGPPGTQVKVTLLRDGTEHVLQVQRERAASAPPRDWSQGVKSAGSTP
ncbi:protein kinase [Archangium gephyra]|uniref:protein kinase domain-containing protein n=1 Tax=Archangium gephyra TaxID=48 RepID=UPI0035D52A00